MYSSAYASTTGISYTGSTIDSKATAMISMLPEELQAVLFTAYKPINDTHSSNIRYMQRKLWVPSYREVTSSTEFTNHAELGTTYEYFKNLSYPLGYCGNNSTKVTLHGATDSGYGYIYNSCLWLRDGSKESPNFASVTGKNGNVYANSAWNKQYFVFGFCI